MSPTALSRSAVLGGLCVLLVLGSVGPGVGVGAVGDVSAQATTPDDRNATTVRHEHPDRLEARGGDLVGLERWLAGRLGGRLGESTVAITRADYETARTLLGPAYHQQRRRYAEIVEATETPSDDAAAEAFAGARERQATFVDQLERYEELNREYEDARRAGDDDRARRLAGELDETAEAVNRTGTQLLGEYARLEAATDVELGGAAARVRAITGVVLDRREDVVDETFVRTQLTATVTPERISFRRPGRVGGRLLAEDGSPVADRRVTLRVGDRSATVETDGSGAFETTYRPVDDPVGPTALSIRFVPAAASAFYGSETNASVTIRPVAPAISISPCRPTASVEAPIGLTGAVRVGPTGVPGVPIVVTLAGQRIGRTSTGSTGLYFLDAPVPATVESGERALVARLGVEDRAIAAAQATAPIRIAETPTALSLEILEAEADRVVVSGQLRTENGTPLPDRRVEVSVAGAANSTVRTGQNGAFGLEVDRDDPAEAATVTARFAGAGTNLGPSRASVVVPGVAVGADDRGASRTDGPWPGGLEPTTVAIGGLVLGGLVGLGVWWWRRAAAGATAPSPADTAGPTATADGPDPDAAAFAAAADLLERGQPDRAVATAYGRVRERLGAGLDRPEPLTHWEFLAAARADGFDPETIDGLERMTERFEHAVFAPEGLSAAQAEATLEAARALLAGAEGR